MVSRKEELFKLQNVEEWDLSPNDLNNISTIRTNKNQAMSNMCYKENEHLINLKNNYAFYSTSLFKEYDRIRNLNAQRFKLNFKLCTEKEIKNVNHVNKLIVIISLL